MSSSRRVAGIAAAGLFAGLLVPPIAAATSGPVIDRPTLIDVGTSNAIDLKSANGHVFISAGNTVLVFDGATLVKTITGQPRAAGMLVSADQSQLYVADSAAARIAVIDTTTLTQTKTYTTLGCPTYLAATTDRLFYSFGCAGSQWQSGIGSVSLADGTDNQESQIPGNNGSLNYSPAELAATGSHLAAISSGLSPTTLATFTASGATLTSAATTAVAGNAVSISPDGSLVAYGQMAPYGATVLEFATLGPNNQMMTGPYPSAVQFSHSGSMLAVGLQAPYGTSTVQVFSMPDAVIQAGSLAQGPGMSYPATAVSMNFATDDSVIYTLLHDTYGAGEDYYMVAPTTPTASPSPTPSASPSPTTSPSPTASPSATPTPSTTPTPTSSPTPTRTPLALSLEIGTVTRPGRDLTMQATLPGRPGVRINFTVSDPGLGDRRIQASTDARGVATASMPVWYSGTANASVDYTENLTVAGAATDFWVPAVAEVNTTGNYKFINGVRYFHRLKDTVVFARAYPGHVSWVKAFLLRKDDGVWRLIGTRFWTTDSTGRVRLSFDNLRHGAVYEQVIEIQGSAYNNPSARVGVSFVVK